VERALANDNEGLKEYALGRDVFDRGETYDPRVNSIVRVEAARLRRKLSEYYHAPGSLDTIVIAFQRGSYVPLFTHAQHIPEKPQTAPTPTAHSERLDARTVAVLPFVNLSSDPDQEFFCDGITEEILTTLTAVSELSVVARTSVFRFKGTTHDVREIGRLLGAGTVIEGSVRKDGAQLRIVAQAIDGASGVLLWTGAFDRELREVFAVQSDIARAVAESLLLTIAPGQQSGEHLEAYTVYLKGRHYWNKVSRDGIEAALHEFTRAIEIDPEYAPPYAGLSEAYARLTVWGLVHPAEGIALARRAAHEALRLDGRMAVACAALGLLAFCSDRDWDEAARWLRRAIDLQPSNTMALAYYGLYHLSLGRFDEVRAIIDRYARLDPVSPWNFRNYGWYHYYHRDYDAAIEAFERALNLDPEFLEMRFLLAHAHLRIGRFEYAIELLNQLPTGPLDAMKWSALGEVYAVAGNSAGGQYALNRLAEIAATTYVSPLNRVAVYAGLGDWDRVVAGLEEAYADQSPLLCLAKVDPRYDPIRADPRFQNILERMRLADR